MTYNIQQGSGGGGVDVYLRSTAFGGAYVSYRLKPDGGIIPDPDLFIELVAPKAVELLKKEQNSVKFNISIRVTYVQAKDADVCVSSSFTSKARKIFKWQNVEAAVMEECEKLCQRAEDFDENGSGWVYAAFEHMDLHIVQYQPLPDSGDDDESSSSDSDCEENYGFL